MKKYIIFFFGFKTPIESIIWRKEKSLVEFRNIFVTFFAFYANFNVFGLKFKLVIMIILGRGVRGFTTEPGVTYILHWQLQHICVWTCHNPGQGDVLLGWVPWSSRRVSNILTQREPCYTKKLQFLPVKPDVSYGTLVNINNNTTTMIYFLLLQKPIY